MLKKIFFAFILVSFINQNLVCQNKYLDNELENITYNVLVSGLISGIGGVINSKSSPSWYIFYSNFLKGSIGGAVIYSAKRTLPLISKHFDNALGYWTNRALLNLGNSIVYNSTMDRDILDSYYLEFYGINMQFKFKDDFEFNIRLSLATALMMVSRFIIFKGEFDIAKTLKYGVYYFDMGEEMYELSGGVKGKKGSAAGGFAMKNMIWVDPLLSAKEKKETEIHELIHTYQFMDYDSFRNFLNPIGDKYIFQKGSFMERLSNYIFFDIPTFYIPYSFLQDYNNSSVEDEADFYAKKIN